MSRMHAKFVSNVLFCPEYLIRVKKINKIANLGL